MTCRIQAKAVFEDTCQRVFAPLTLFIWATGWIAGAIAGPFGTFEDMDLSLRVAFWFFIASSAVILGYGARAVAMLAIPQDRPALGDCVSIALTTFTLGPLIFVVGSYVEYRAGAPVPPLAMVLLYVFVICAPVFVLRRLAPGFEKYGYRLDGKTPALKEQPRLLKRLPTEVRGEVLRLSASGHFTEVVTTNGRHTLRLRMADAIEETDPIEGLSTHRSHWVARAAIQGVERENAHRIHLILTNDDRVPVSRSYRSELEAGGLLE